MNKRNNSIIRPTLLMRELEFDKGGDESEDAAKNQIRRRRSKLEIKVKLREGLKNK
jgi:hypothetical protein